MDDVHIRESLLAISLLPVPGGPMSSMCSPQRTARHISLTSLSLSTSPSDRWSMSCCREFCNEFEGEEKDVEEEKEEERVGVGEELLENMFAATSTSACCFALTFKSDNLATSSDPVPEIFCALSNNVCNVCLCARAYAKRFEMCNEEDVGGRL